MLQNFKVTSYAIISCLSGLALMAVSPVFAADSAGLTVCANMGKAEQESGEMKNCFMELTRSLQAELEEAANALSSQEAVVDQAVSQSADAEGTKEALKLQIEEISGWLKDKDAKIADLQEQLSTTRSELQAKDETIADLQRQLSSFEQSQAKDDATIAELQEQLSTASSESQAKDETIADLTDRLAAAMEGSTQGSGAGTASDNKHLNGEGPQEHFWPCTRGGFGEIRACMAGELTEWRDGCEGTFEALSDLGSLSLCRDVMRKVGQE